MARWRVVLADGELVIETAHGLGEMSIALTRAGVTVIATAEVLSAQEIRVKLGAAIGVAQGELQ